MLVSGVGMWPGSIKDAWYPVFTPSSSASRDIWQYLGTFLVVGTRSGRML